MRAWSTRNSVGVWSSFRNLTRGSRKSQIAYRPCQMMHATRGAPWRDILVACCTGLSRMLVGSKLSIRLSDDQIDQSERNAIFCRPFCQFASCNLTKSPPADRWNCFAHCEGRSRRSEVNKKMAEQDDIRGKGELVTLIRGFA